VPAPSSARVVAMTAIHLRVEFDVIVSASIRGPGKLAKSSVEAYADSSHYV
jgi:hypothetical protein